MSTNTARRFKNIKNFNFGETQYTTIKKVGYARKKTMLKAAGDNDRFHSFQDEGLIEVSGSVQIDETALFPLP